MTSKHYPMPINSHQKSLKQPQSIDAHPPQKTTLIAEETEYEIENIFIFKSPYIESIQAKLGSNEGLRIKLPRWVPKSSLEIVLIYLKYDKIPDISNASTSTIQRVLWLGDFLRLQEFQQKFIQDKLLPSLNKSNCVVFLNESFKKLCSSEACPDSWYALFNSSMNILAKNLGWNFLNKKTDLFQMNDKILEETIERALKFNKVQFSPDQNELIEILLHLRKENSIFELLDNQRKIVMGRKLINNPNQLNNIVWKLSNLNRIVGKETNPFKLGGFSWRLVAKAKKDENKDDQLHFYLKLESPVSQHGGNDNDQSNNSSSNHNEILTISFVMKVNGTLLNKDIQIRSMNFEKSPYIKLHSLEKQEISQLSNRENEFAVHLNLEYVYSSILINISKNIERYISLKNSTLLTRDDICAVLRNLPSNTISHEHGLSLVSSWLSSNKNEPEISEIFKSIEWRLAPISSLTKALNSEGFRGSIIARQLLEKEISKKRDDSTRSSKDNIFKSSTSEQFGKKENIDLDLSREPLRSVQNVSQGHLQRGRILNQSHHNVEAEQSRHYSLQKEPFSKAQSLNTSLRSNNETPNVPRIFQNRTMATETSPSPNKILNSRISLSPKKYYAERSFDKHQEYYSKTLGDPHSSVPSQNDLSSMDSKPVSHHLQSPTTNILSKTQTMLSDISSRDGKTVASSLSLTTNKAMLSGNNLPKVGFISPVTSPTHNSNIAISMNFHSVKDTLVSPVHERLTSTSLNNISGLSASFNTQIKPLEKRNLNQTSSNLNTAMKSRDASLGKRDSYSSDTSEFKRFNDRNIPSLEEVREMYSLTTKSAQEKITKIRRALQKEKEMIKREVFETLDAKNYLVGEKLDIFD